MTKFITLSETYNPLTSQGLGEKIINVSEIIHITSFTTSPSKRIKTIRSRIQLTNGDIFDVKLTKNKILEMIKEP